MPESWGEVKQKLIKLLMQSSEGSWQVMLHLCVLSRWKNMHMLFNQIKFKKSWHSYICRQLPASRFVHSILFLNIETEWVTVGKKNAAHVTNELPLQLDLPLSDQATFIGYFLDPAVVVLLINSEFNHNRQLSSQPATNKHTYLHIFFCF